MYSFEDTNDLKTLWKLSLPAEPLEQMADRHCHLVQKGIQTHKRSNKVF